MTEYLLVALIVFAVNLLPAFGPPTSAVLVALTLNFDLEPVPLVISGALAAASGRYLLAWGTRRLRPRFSEERRRSLAAAQQALTDRRGKTIAGLGLFALSPVPSAQLFVAAGMMTVPLLPLTLSFFAGRVVSYSIYVAGAETIKESSGEVVTDALTSPLGIVLQVVMLAALVALWRVDWAKVLVGRRGDEEAGAQ